MLKPLQHRARSRKPSRSTRERSKGRRRDINARTLAVEPLESRRLLSTDVCGSVEGIWDLAGSPYILTCEVTVEPGKTLNIEAGVEVQSQRVQLQ